jgi:putative copper resistance protein D
VFLLSYSGRLISNPDGMRIRRIAIALAVISLLAGGAQILVTAGSMGGAAAGMWDGTLVHLVWQTGAGRAYGIRAAGLVLLALCALRNGLPWPACLGAIAAADSFAWTGHAWSLHPHVLSVLLLSLHLLAAAFWLGALAPLAIVARNGDLPDIAAAISRFGRCALFVVAALIAAGLSLLGLLLGSVSNLWASDYGRCVLLKLSLVGSLMCVAAFNKLNLTPRLLAGDVRAIRTLRLSLRLELLLGALILAVTATLTTITGAPALN